MVLPSRPGERTARPPAARVSPGISPEDRSGYVTSRSPRTAGSGARCTGSRRRGPSPEDTTRARNGRAAVAPPWHAVASRSGASRRARGPSRPSSLRARHRSDASLPGLGLPLDRSPTLSYTVRTRVRTNNGRGNASDERYRTGPCPHALSISAARVKWLRLPRRRGSCAHSTGLPGEVLPDGEPPGVPAISFSRVAGRIRSSRPVGGADRCRRGMRLPCRGRSGRHHSRRSTGRPCRARRADRAGRHGRGHR